MSKFGYLEQGELNSQYLYELLDEYLDNIIEANDTKGIIAEDEFKIDVGASNFKRGFNNFKNKMHIKFSRKNTLENYNKLMSFNYAKSIKNRLKIYATANMLEPKDLFDIIQISKTIGFNKVIPEIEVNRNKAIAKCNKGVLKCYDDTKYLKNALSKQVLFNSPVADIKPFLSEEVTVHTMRADVLEEVLANMVQMRTEELGQLDFDPYLVEFENNLEDFYHSQITSDGVGEDVEDFIRSKMLQKLVISKRDEVLVEDRLAQIAVIDNQLKRLGIGKLEKLMQKVIKLKCNVAQAQEGIERCKKLLNNSNIVNKDNIFLTMDTLYYKLENKCKKLTEKVKLKLQLVDKQRLFDAVNNMESEAEAKRVKRETVEPKTEEQPIIHIAEDEPTDSQTDNNSNDEEFIIDDEE